MRAGDYSAIADVHRDAGNMDEALAYYEKPAERTPPIRQSFYAI